MHVFKADKKGLTSLAFAPDGATLLTAAPERIQRWSVPDGTPQRQWPAPRSWPHLAISPDGQFLATCGHGGGGHTFSLRTIAGKNVVKERRYTQSFAFTPDGEDVFVAGQDVALGRWRVEDGIEIPCGWGGTRETRDGTFPNGYVTCHPHEPIVAASFGEPTGTAAGYQSLIEFYDRESGEMVSQIRAPHRFDHVAKLQFGPGGDVIAGLCGPLWRVWSTETGELLAEEQTGRKHLQDFVFSPDGSRLLTVGNDALVRVWNTSDWTEASGFEWDIGPLTCIAVSPDGTLYAAGSKKGKVVLWDDWP